MCGFGPFTEFFFLPSFTLIRIVLFLISNAISLSGGRWRRRAKGRRWKPKKKQKKTKKKEKAKAKRQKSIVQLKHERIDGSNGIF